MTEPTTEAGRRLVADYEDIFDPAPRVLAIEAEARADALREVPALHPDDGYAYEGCNGFACRTLRAELAR